MLFWLIIFSSKTIFYSNQLISVPRLLTCGKQPKKVKQNQSKKQTNKQNESLLGIKPLRDYLYVLFQWWKSIVYCLFSRPNQKTQSRCQLWSNGCAHITVSSISVCVRVRAQCDPTAQQHWPLLETACLRLWSIYTEPTVPSLHNIRKWKQMSLSFSHSLHSILLSLSIYLMHTHTWTSGLCVHILYIAYQAGNKGSVSLFELPGTYSHIVTYHPWLRYYFLLTTQPFFCFLSQNPTLNLRSLTCCHWWACRFD